MSLQRNRCFKPESEAQKGEEYMTGIDLWADDDDSGDTLLAFQEEIPEVPDGSVLITLTGDRIHIYSRTELSEDFENLNGLTQENTSDEKLTSLSCRLSAANAFALRYSLIGMHVVLEAEDAGTLKNMADTVNRPVAVLTEDGRRIQVSVPPLKIYRELLSKVNGYPTRDGYRIDISRALDLENLSKKLDTHLPKVHFDDDVLSLSRDPIPGYDGTLESLKKIPTNVLNVVNANNQPVKSLKSSRQTIREKMEGLGIRNLYDLLFFLPRRYIDKSNPQDISDLIEGETAVVVGVIEDSEEMMFGRGGAAFTIRTSTGSKIRAAFFNQKWLLSKFKVDDMVLVTGKFSWWKRRPQISGASIEHAEEAAVLPIVPVYKQSPSKGVTTYLIMSSIRELISRMKTAQLPEYLEQHGFMTYFDTLRSLHFPESIEESSISFDDMAFYELVHMQILIQKDREDSQNRHGLTIEEGSGKLQARAIKSLPFSLTTSQKRAIVELNKKLSEGRPSAILLTADVGAGKTVIAEMAALRAVDAGYQSVILSPTDVLARQLFKSFSQLSEQIGGVKVVFLSSSVKKKEQNEVRALIESGEADVVVGTHSVMSECVKFKNLGFIAVDEQQKFGTEQRSRLLHSREDGLIPDLLMQTATPIPRSAAQAFYGGVDIIQLKEKPKGRLPIETFWIKEDPVDITERTTDEVWTDVVNEAKKGHQTFIITPLVSESGKIDAASVERTFKNLSTVALAGLRVAQVHGQMKSDDQIKIMEDFRNGEYDVLVSSTVVEVGVDVPNATRVVILSAERLGSSSLHQIRGRVGRSDKPSKCYLVSLGGRENAEARMTALVNSNDGFEIAQSDLRLRGEGRMFGTEQSGISGMTFASLTRNADMIEDAQQEAVSILRGPLKDKAVRAAEELFDNEETMV